VPTPLVAIYVVTYRRPHLLRRALGSLLTQTFGDWVAHVINDDPSDERVHSLIRDLDDPRISLFEPGKRRGGAANFNLAFQERACEFGSILEDDNWWEPGFLESMLAALRSQLEIEIACGNERIYREQPDGQWTDTGSIIWPDCQDAFYSTDIETACGSAKLCNSALLFRTRRSHAWRTPDDLPIDVTEHFRERVLPQPIRLVGAPLVNYGETMVTNRRTGGTLWADYQCLLIGSCFASTPPRLREQLACRLWTAVTDRRSPRATGFLMTALAFPEARVLWRTSSIVHRSLAVATAVRRLPNVLQIAQVRGRLGNHLAFLCESPFNRRLEAGLV
jgi:Glycosyl transferase family 2